MKIKRSLDYKGFVSRSLYYYKNLSFFKHLLLYYLIITLVGALFLYAPFSHRNNIHVGFGDALFTAASAFSDTGLTPLVTSYTWSYFGQAVIAILILVGGIGWFALKVYLFNILLGRPLSFATREVLAAERGSNNVGSSKNIVKVSVTMLFIIIILAAVALTLVFYYTPADDDPYDVAGKNVSVSDHRSVGSIASLHGLAGLLENPQGNVSTSLRFGIFHAISALNNAGFDIMGANSIAPYYHNFGVQVIFIVLFMIGGTGFPVIYDIWGWIKAKFRKEKYYWSLFTKLSVSVYAIVATLGVAVTFAIETTAKNYYVDGNSQVYTFWNNPMYGTQADKGFALFFNSLSTRNAGFSTIRLGDLTPSTTMIFSILMFIGSAPSSTAGGIRTTTLGVILIGVWSKIRGRESVRMFNRRVPTATVTRSYVVFVVSLVLVIVGALVALSSFAYQGGELNSDTEHMFWMNVVGPQDSFIATQYTFNEALLETASAFGTTGLSSGLTPFLSLGTKLVLILVMFAGQLGISTTLSIWKSRNSKARRYNFVKEDVTIG